ncbi:MAG: hypothetical protein HKN16_05485, partial [Saprospiraceae bacterium]|nr:hypothetical protein [Saprospiraceae bacterium]
MKHIIPAIAMVCLVLTSGLSQQSWYKLEKLSSSINSDESHELRPIVTRDGSCIYFTKQGSEDFNHVLQEGGIDLSKYLSDEEYILKLKEVYSGLSGVEEENPIRSSFNQDIWLVNQFDSNRPIVKRLPSPINNA